MNTLKFDASIIPTSNRAEAYVRSIINDLEQAEHRKRKRKPIDLRNFRQQVSALASCLILAGLDGLPLRYRRNHRDNGQISRYRPEFMTKAFKDVADAFVRLGLAREDRGKRDWNTGKDIASLLHPQLETAELTKADFGLSCNSECIILRAEKEYNETKGKALEYDDDENTNTMRRQVHGINSWLSTAGLGPVSLYRVFTNGGFDQCGRLYGGHWQSMKKAERKEHLRINGEPVVTLDYGQTSLRIAYGRAGIDPPEGDLYAIPGFPYREGIKGLVTRMLAVDKPYDKRPPKLDGLPLGIDFQCLTRAILKHHQGVEGMFHQGLSNDLMFHEGNLMVDLLDELKGRQIIALPVYDAVIVPKEQAQVVKPIMLSMFEDKFKVRAKVGIE